MQSLVRIVAEQLQALSVLELLAVVLAIAYLLFAIRQNIWCWLCAAISTAIYVYLFILAKLYMESALNAFYFGMAIYGWWVWSAGTGGHELPVTSWPAKIHSVAIAAIVLVSLANGLVLDRYTDAAYAYIDSMTTYAALWATFLVARKVLENWWYWVVIDLASIAIYWNRELELTALLFAMYVLMIPFGLLAWTRSYRQQQAVVAA